MTEEKEKTITTVRGRFIGGGLFEMKEGKSKFNACIVFESEQDAERIRKIRAEALEKEFGNKVPKGLQDWTLRKGDDEEYEHSYGQFYINPGSKNRIAVVTRRDGKSIPITAEEGIIYPGCYVHASVSAYAYGGDPKKNIKPGVTLGLRAVCFWKDGEPLGNRFDDSEFEGCESELDAAAFGDSETVSSLL